MKKNKEAFDSLKKLENEIEKDLKKQLKENETLRWAGFKDKDLFTGIIGVAYAVEYDRKAKSGRITRKRIKLYIKCTYNPFTGEKFMMDEGDDE